MTPRLSLLWRMPNQKKTYKTPLYHYLSNNPTPIPCCGECLIKKTSKTPLYHYLSNDPTPIPVVENA